MIRAPALLPDHCKWAPTACQRAVWGKGRSKNKHIFLSQDSKFFRKLRFVGRTACSIIKTSMLLQFEFQTTVAQNKQPSQSQADLRANVNKLSQRVAVVYRAESSLT